MNIHFGRGDFDYERPRRLYAMLDHLEIPEIEGRVLLAFDAVDADWIDGQAKDVRFDPSSPETLEKAWTQYWSEPTREIASPFNAMPLYRLEVDYERGRGPTGPLELVSDDDKFDFHLGGFEKT